MSTDADLVAGVLDGDRESFAAMYDRYADRLYDFCYSVLRDRQDAEDAVQDTFVLVAQRLAQLNDPDRLRPWLYAVARSVALRRTRARKRVVLDTEVTDMPDPAVGPHRAAELDDLRELVWNAAAGLSDRDRALLDLHVRQGLDGAELGDAMGVSASHAYVLLTRLRDQVERSLGAFLIARLGRDDCVELGDLLSGWDGRFSPLMRKRVARHVDQCELCGDRRRTMVSPIALLGAVPLIAAPITLRDRVLDEVELVSYEGGPPKPPRPSRVPMLAAASALVVAIGLATVWDLGTDEPGNAVSQDQLPIAPDSTSPTPPTLVPPTSTTPTTTTTAPPTTTTTTRRPATTTTTTNGELVEPPPPLPPPEEPPEEPPPPPPDTSPPQIVRQSAVNRVIFINECGPPNTNTVNAVITDNVEAAGATLSWTGPGEGQGGSKPMTRNGDGWSATMGSFSISGGIVWQITAVDTAGNRVTGQTDKFSVESCVG